MPSDVVAYEAKARYSGICFHYAAESTLCVLCHRIRLVQNNYFERGTWIRFSIWVDCLGPRCLTSEVFNFVANDCNPSFVWSIELKDSVFEIVWSNMIKTKRRNEKRTVIKISEYLPKKLSCQGQDCGGLSRSWGTVEKHMGKLCIVLARMSRSFQATDIRWSQRFP